MFNPYAYFFYEKNLFNIPKHIISSWSILTSILIFMALLNQLFFTTYVVLS